MNARTVLAAVCAKCAASLGHTGEQRTFIVRGRCAKCERFMTEQAPGRWVPRADVLRGCEVRV